MSNQVICLYDTETTGFTSTDEVIQWAGIFYSLTKREIIGYFNEYFWTQTPINPGAFNAHGINRKTLVEKSKGKTFEVFLEDRLKFLKNNFRGTFVAFNESFDHRLINQTLTLQGYEGFGMGPIISDENNILNLGRYRSRFCLMNFFKRRLGLSKNPGLDSCITAMGLVRTQIRESFLKEFPKESFEGNLHNALFDSYVMLRLVEEMISRDGSIRGAEAN